MPDEAVSFLDEVIEAHGGHQLWRQTESLEVELSLSGFLFTAKRVPVQVRKTIQAQTAEPCFVFRDFPAAGQRGELNGDQEARIVNADGTVSLSRTNPRRSFGFRSNFGWDYLDFIYFGGYATWNYLTTPFLFMRPGFTFEMLGERQLPTGKCTAVRATFPADIPTHCRQQVFYFDEQKMLRRLDYTAKVVGGWARVAHLCLEHANFDGLIVPIRRRVYPIFFNRPMRFPLIVAIDIHDVRLKPKAS